MRIQKPQKKLYYSLRQVSRMLGVDASEIAKWEKDFNKVKPIRNRAGNRSYLERDLPVLFYIKEELRSHRKRDIESDTLHMQKILAEIKLEIGEIRKLFR